MYRVLFYRSLSTLQCQQQSHIFRAAGFQVWNWVNVFGLHHCNGGSSIFLSTITFTPKAWPLSKLKGERGGSKNVSLLSEEEEFQESLNSLQSLDEQGICPDSTIYAPFLQRCAKRKALAVGMWLHAHMIETGFDMDYFIGNNLINMYAKCGSLVDARNVFDKMPDRNVVSWTAMISGYDQNRHGVEALELFFQMHGEGICTNEFTFSSVLSTCARLEIMEQGKQIHVHTLKTGFESNVFVGNALVTMYSKCGDLIGARQVFDKMPYADEVSWNTIIAGHAQHGSNTETLELFCQMQQIGMKQDHFTLASVLTACASLADLKQGNQVHGCIIKSGFQPDVFVGSALVDMYAKCQNIEDALKVFQTMTERDVVSWNVMIEGYSQNEEGEEALKLFAQMQGVGMKPDQLTFVSILGVCTSLAILEHGKQFHVHITKNGLDDDVRMGNALVDMYAKCGSMEDALKKFDKMAERNVVSWTAMITGFAQHGCGKEAIELFEQMQQAGVKPNDVTFLCILSACSRVGLLDEGRHYFDSMRRVHGIIPKVEHYACMVDLLGRAGLLDEADNFIKKIPFEPGALVWQTLLGACKVHGNMELGKHVAERIIELEQHDAPTYVLLSNIYAGAGRWDEVAKVRRMMKDRGLKKEPGCSWIEVQNKVHIFLIRDRSHQQTEEIYSKLEEKTWQMKRAGYVLSPQVFCST